MRLARSGVSQTSNGGLGNGIRTQAVSRGVVMICLYLDILLLNTPLSLYLVGRNLRLLPGQETLGTTPKEYVSCLRSCPIHHSTFPEGSWMPRTLYLSKGVTAAKACTSMHLRGISCRRFSRAKVPKVSCTGAPRLGKRRTLSLRGTAFKRRGPNPISRGALIVLR